MVNDTLDLMEEIEADAAANSDSGDGPDGAVAATAANMQREAIAAMNVLGDVKDFPSVFVDFARRTGLRLVLLKRWTSGLQVFLEENVSLPEESKQKRRDGKAPIPTTDDDIFSVLGQDVSVYCGPVPMKHFPLDLTIMLGRGSRERRILILPLPSGSHCNTFLYLDADANLAEALDTAEILAQFALTRMKLISSGGATGGSRADSILAVEMERRREETSRDAVPAPSADESTGVGLAEPVPTCVAGEGNMADAMPPVPAWDRQVRDGGGLTPEVIFEQSGELPALPKAACHIMAVIEDPQTTATKLEQALAMDQALTAKVLRIANSPFYGAVREITTVSEAIVRLGFVAIRNWTLVTAARSVFLAPGAGMLYQKIWRQSVMSAMAGQLVAQATGRANPEMVFVGGLMQNIGQLVLARSHPELFQEILNDSASRNLPYHEVERERLGFDHGELGALLIREWNLSPELEEAVRWHHHFADHLESPIAAMIALGEDIAWCSSSGEEDSEVEEGEAAEILGLAPDQVEDLKTKAAELQIDPHFFN